MPSELCHWSIDLGIEPALIDTMGQTISIDSSGRCLEISIVTIEQLVPETIVMLQLSQSCSVSLEQLHNLSPFGMFGRQHIQHLTHRQNSPSIGPSPVEGRMFLHRLYPSVTEEALLGHEHPLGKLKHLTSSLIIVLGSACQLTHIGYCRDAHEHIVEPKRVLLWTDTGKGTVGKSVLLI